VAALTEARWREVWRLLREEPKLLAYFVRRLPGAIQRRLLGRRALASPLHEE